MVMGSIPEKVDVAVIGGGVGGYIAAIRAAELGKSVALIEKEKLGGHCLNYACIPSKTLIHISDILHTAKNSEKFGITVDGIKLDAKKMLEWRMGVSKKLEEGVAFLCRSNGIDVFNGAATFLNSNTIQLTEGITIEFKKAIIATGSEPIPLASLPFGENIIDYKKALMMDSIPKTMIIIGGGYVSVELSMLYAKLGSEIHIIARSDILSRFDQEAVVILKKRMEDLGIKIHKNSSIISHDEKTVTTDKGEQLPYDKIVVAVGLSPFTEGLGLNNTGVTTSKEGFIEVDNSLFTSDKNILAIGDVAGNPMLAHKAMRQGVIAGEAASDMKSFFDNIVIPSVIFSDPEIAVAGTIEENDSIKIIKFPMSAIGRSIAIDAKEGFVKIAYDKSMIVKGVEIVSKDANSMIAEAALAIEMGATLEDIASTIHPHPTLSEAIQEAAEAGIGTPIHFFYNKKKNE